MTKKWALILLALVFVSCNENASENLASIAKHRDDKSNDNGKGPKDKKDKCEDDSSDDDSSSEDPMPDPEPVPGCDIKGDGVYFLSLFGDTVCVGDTLEVKFGGGFVGEELTLNDIDQVNWVATNPKHTISNTGTYQYTIPAKLGVRSLYLEKCRNQPAWSWAYSATFTVIDCK